MRVEAGVHSIEQKQTDTTSAALGLVAELLTSTHLHAARQVEIATLASFRLMCTAMMSSRRLFVGIFVIATLVDQNSAHVRLTYPPARQYALDFLDNVRTDPPCGMEAGNHGDL